MNVFNLDHQPSARAVHDGAAVNAWFGLRYATAAGRFTAPRRATGRLHATRLAEVPIFAQRPSRLTTAMGQGKANPQSEDAFFINVWAPEQADRLPVLFFIHGGAWTTGGGSMEWYDGGRLASRGVVVVNVNYRVGALGHLGPSDAHQLPLPAADLLLALQWTTEHVAAYGGDPHRITIAGQSAGGWYGHLLSVLPETRGIVHRVAHLSMGTRAPWTPRRQASVTSATGKFLDDNVIATAPVDELMAAGEQALMGERPVLGQAPSGFLPVASPGLPDRLLDPGWAAQACHAEAVYLRYTADESAMFFFDSDMQTGASQDQVDATLSEWDPADIPRLLKREDTYAGDGSGMSPYRQLVAASSWRQFQRFPAEYTDALTHAGRAARLEVFTHESPLPNLHSGHCFDLPFQFGTRDAWNDAPMLRGIGADHFNSISDQLITGLTAFAAGAPVTPEAESTLR